MSSAPSSMALRLLSAAAGATAAAVMAVSKERRRMAEETTAEGSRQASTVVTSKTAVSPSSPPATPSYSDGLFQRIDRHTAFPAPIHELIQDRDLESASLSSAAAAAAAARVNPNEQSEHQRQAERLKRAVTYAGNLALTRFYESGSPGMVVAVAVNGKVLMRQGYGFADVENRILASPGTIMRIASISKSLTTVAVGRLMEEGKLDLDRPVTEYVPSWPSHHPAITTRQLLSHLAGVRHYTKKGQKEDVSDGESGGDGRFKEFLSNRKFESVGKAMDVFKNDELLSPPGSEFHYTTHGYTLLSAVVESASGEKFERHMRRLFRDLGLKNTDLDEHQKIVRNRARYYVRDKQHNLQNAPQVDNSVKWAGGGFVSNVGDLVKFGTAMLYSYQQDQTQSPKQIDKVTDEPKASADDVVYRPGPYSMVNRRDGVASTKDNTQPPLAPPLPGFLRSETMKALWAPVVRHFKDGESLNDNYYAMGWEVMPEIKHHAHARSQPLAFLHTGGAVGASSVLLILPREKDVNKNVNNDDSKTEVPDGVVVAILCNMQGVGGLRQLAFDIAKEFQNLKPDGPHRVQKLYQC